MQISILAVLADRDQRLRRSIRKVCISILAILADRDAVTANFPYVDVLFQSSRSLRTATRPEISLRPSALHFNPRGPCGPRRTADQLAAWCFEFQSSRSLRTATWVGTVITSITGISILAVLADRDPSFPGFPSRICISILAVLADRDVHDMDVTADGELFQSSRSLRTATGSA